VFLYHKEVAGSCNSMDAATATAAITYNKEGATEVDYDSLNYLVDRLVDIVTVMVITIAMASFHLYSSQVLHYCYCSIMGVFA